MSNEVGFIFATTGEAYTRLAIKAALTVAQHHPDVPIDIFTDQNCDSDVFAKIHKIDGNTKRPRMRALLATRFNRTIYLDADVIVVAPVYDIFEILNHFDIALAHDQFANSELGSQHWNVDIPAAFPQFNAGVMGIRSGNKVSDLMSKWDTVFHEKDRPRDQPFLRELLFLSDLRIATLPDAYNLMALDVARGWSSRQLAPRIIHHFWLHMEDSNGDFVFEDLDDLLGKKFLKHIQTLILNDRSLNDLPVHVDTVRSFSDRFPNTGLPTPLTKSKQKMMLNLVHRIISKSDR